MSVGQRRRRRRQRLKQLRGYVSTDRSRHQPPVEDQDLDWRPPSKFSVRVPLPRARKPWNGFRGAHNPLSNFFRYDIHYKGEVYLSSEHLYQASKARCAGNDTLREQIMEAPTGSRAKLISKHVVLSPQQMTTWLHERVRVMKMTLELKYQQCPAFRLALTPNRHHVEMTSDDFWAAGLPKYMLQGASQYPGQNVLGRLLDHLSQHGNLDNTSM